MAQKVYMGELLSRRRFVAGALLGAAARPAERRIQKEIFLRSPGKGTAVMAYAYYTRPRGGEMLSIEQRWIERAGSLPGFVICDW